MLSSEETDRTEIYTPRLLIGQNLHQPRKITNYVIPNFLQIWTVFFLRYGYMKTQWPVKIVTKFARKY